MKFLVESNCGDIPSLRDLMHPDSARYGGGGEGPFHHDSAGYSIEGGRERSFVLSGYVSEILQQGYV